MKKKNLVFTIIAIVSVLLMIVAVILDNDASLWLGVIGSTALFVIAILKWIVPTKKNTLFKILALTTLYFLMLSWIIPASTASGTTVSDLGLRRMSLYSIIEYPYLSFQFFLQPLLYLLAVGGLYGILTEISNYRKILEKIAKSMKGKETVFLCLVAFVLACLSSLFGLNILLFILMPALVAIILLMGYDKLTAFLTVFISPLVGIIGSTYSTNVVGYINQVVGTDFTTELVAKVGLFVLSYAVFTYFLVKYANKNKSKTAELSEKLELILLGEKKPSKKASWPIILIFSLFTVLLILGFTNWEAVFKTSVFTDLHADLTKWKIGGYTILSYLIGDIDQFGSWNFEQFIVITVLSSIVLSLVYKLSLEDALKAFYKGVIKVLKPAVLVILAYVLVIITAYHPFIITVTDALVGLVSSATGTIGNVLHVIVTGISTILSTTLNIEMLYIAQSTLPYVSSTYESIMDTIAIVTQAVYGLTLFVAPTSSLMILGLEFLEIPYKEWLKNSWKLVLSLLAVIAVVVIVVMIIA